VVLAIEETEGLNADVFDVLFSSVANCHGAIDVRSRPRADIQMGS